jgi:hypothetical protein
MAERSKPMTAPFLTFILFHVSTSNNLQCSRPQPCIGQHPDSHTQLACSHHCVGVRCLLAVDAAWCVHAWRTIGVLLRCVGACAWSQSHGVLWVSQALHGSCVCVLREMPARSRIGVSQHPQHTGKLQFRLWLVPAQACMAASQAEQERVGQWCSLSPAYYPTNAVGGTASSCCSGLNNICNAGLCDRVGRSNR